MAILAECNRCHRRQRLKNKRCKCGNDLDAAKRSQKICYWISYRMPGGKQRRERVGFSIEEARDAEGKRRSQKRENRIFEMEPEAKMTFGQLAEWYLDLSSVNNLSSFDRVQLCLKQFNKVFGTIMVNQMKLSDLEEYQAKRQNERKAPATIDMEISIVKTMINKAFDNDKVGGRTLKIFKKCKKLLKNNSNARDRILSTGERSELLRRLPPHTLAIVAIALYTGMRKKEILSLTWDKVNMSKKRIYLEAIDTKDNEPRIIPIFDELYKILEAIPKAIHDNHVILYDGKPIKDIRAALRTSCKEANIPYGRFIRGGFIFHDLRHTFNTNMRKAGVHQSVIMSMTGHSTDVMFQRYNTVDDEDLDEAMCKLRLYLKNVDQNVDEESISAQEENKKV